MRSDSSDACSSRLLAAADHGVQARISIAESAGKEKSPKNAVDRCNRRPVTCEGRQSLPRQPGGADKGGEKKDDGKKKMVGLGGTDRQRNVLDEEEIDWRYRLEVQGGTANDGVGQASIHVGLLGANFYPRTIRVLRANWRFVQDELDRDVLDVLAERLRMQGVVAIRDESGLTLAGDVAGNRIVHVSIRLWPIPGSDASTAHWRLLLPRRLGETRLLAAPQTRVEAVPVTDPVPSLPQRPALPAPSQILAGEPALVTALQANVVQAGRAAVEPYGQPADDAVTMSVEQPRPYLTDR